ncbi:general secretion pathway protein GspL [Escherichia coli]|nr:general secretion pathway protein GspL [Escherichia coli]OTD61689.1 general secretion pathway protein GspL [Escherichia coli]
MSIYIDRRDCCQTGQFSQDVADGALTSFATPLPFLYIHPRLFCA